MAISIDHPRAHPHASGGCCANGRHHGNGKSVGPLASVDDALALILEHARPALERERVPLMDAVGRVLPVDLWSGIDVPPMDNSAVDGYALRAEDVRTAGSILPVTQRIAAGSTGTALEPGTAARVFTGAPIPPGADAVVMQEDCRSEGAAVAVTVPVVAGANVRRAGEDIEAGERVLRAGRRLLPQDIGVVASTGVSSVIVNRRLRVGILSTGSELVEPGEPADPGQIYNSNRYTLRALLERLGCDVVDRGIVHDGLDTTRTVLAQLAGQVDVVISTGGVSVGEEDHVRAALESLGEVLLWGVAMKPGKPLVFATVGESAFIGLPGNPVALYVAFCVFARPFILCAQGCSEVLARPLTVQAGFDAARPARRCEYLRARVICGPDGEQRAVLHDNQGSGVLSSTVWSDGLVMVPAGGTVRRWL
jgi:molybdopterin molybdotransferase